MKASGNTRLTPIKFFFLQSLTRNKSSLEGMSLLNFYSLSIPFTWIIPKINLQTR